ncbi:MAG: hypothetical protein CMK59_05850, partial [Proteobacteria bacterium]|nr:hypothetical protein [Pseudomonadota bacterium]
EGKVQKDWADQTETLDRIKLYVEKGLIYPVSTKANSEWRFEYYKTPETYNPTPEEIEAAKVTEDLGTNVTRLFPALWEVLSEGVVLIADEKAAKKETDSENIAIVKHKIKYCIDDARSNNRESEMIHGPLNRLLEVLS